jgi:hypothetical protein
MSFDLQVWSVSKPTGGSFTERPEWVAHGSTWCRTAQNWQIVVNGTDRVESEDIPDEIDMVVPGVHFLTEINLEGTASKAALQLARAAATAIARECHGVVFDPQRELVKTPSGIKRLPPFKKGARVSVVRLSWWFMESPLLTEEGRKLFVDLIERAFPEALPNRYGLWEPPQHKYSEAGKTHFLNLWTDNLHDLIVWKTQRPVRSVSAMFPNPLGPFRKGFRSNRFTIDIELDLLRHPGWNTQVQRFWRAASKLISPFYGEARILQGQPADGWYSVEDSIRQSEPVSSWWWRGVPSRLGCALVASEPYLGLWPQLRASGVMFKGLAFVSQADWTDGNDVEMLTSPVPAEIASPEWETIHFTPEAYAKVWPFAFPFTDRPK